MRRVMAVFLFAFFAVGAGAQASTTIIEPVGSHFPYQRWIDESQMPTPDVTLEVIEQPPGQGCPSVPGVDACSVVAEDRVWIGAADLIGNNPRETFMHEIGHYEDADVMPEWARERFDTLYGLGGPWLLPGSGQMTAGEWFAEAYAECAAKPYITLKEWNAVDRGPIYNARPIFEMRVAHNKTCRMIEVASGDSRV
jgi:hypothetical protein